MGFPPFRVGPSLEPQRDDTQLDPASTRSVPGRPAASRPAHLPIFALTSSVQFCTRIVRVTFSRPLPA